MKVVVAGRVSSRPTSRRHGCVVRRLTGGAVCVGRRGSAPRHSTRWPASTRRRSLPDSTYAHLPPELTPTGHVRPGSLLAASADRPDVHGRRQVRRLDEPSATAAADLPALAARHCGLRPTSTRGPCPSDARRARPCWRSPAASPGTSRRSRGVPCVLRCSSCGPLHHSWSLSLRPCRPGGRPRTT